MIHQGHVECIGTATGRKLNFTANIGTIPVANHIIDIGTQDWIIHQRSKGL
ncbi:hypothetical protein [uncultured Paraglaciecola sp.]|uniref:hypothetical protein n=1 Tax=uncultured Paraglaciecola sp. TaxID=1765024 RepID=UPI002621B943|nr:hypothetical protein [uncultured Paraglaciecola sp.]